MPRPLPFALLVGLIGCGPTESVLQLDPFALAFQGDGCVQAEGPIVDLSDGFTVEAWVRGGSASGQAALVAFDDVAVLWAAADRTGLSDPNDPDGGWEGARSIYDGQKHHVAGTWSSQGGAIWVDGEQVGSGTGWSPSLDGAFATIGCGSNGGRFFDGVLDEVRISSVVRYTSGFTIEPLPFDEDGETLALWHLDAGAGELALEANDAYPGVIENATWTAGLVRAPRDGAETGDQAP